MGKIMRVRAASSGWTGGPGLNTFYFSAGNLLEEGDPVLADAELAHTRVHSAFTDAASLYPPAWHLAVSPTVDVLNAANGELVDSFSVSPSADVVGTAVAQFAPLATAMLAQLRTSTFADGSRIQGRAFLGPVTAGLDGNGVPLVEEKDTVLAFGAALQDAGPGGVPVLVVWRRPRDADPDHLPQPVTARDGTQAKVTSITVANKFAVLRSRRD